MTDLSIRPAGEADLERLVEIHSSAYPSDASFERRKRSFSLAGVGPSGAVRVVERRRRIVGHAKLHDFTVWLGGQAVRTGGIGSVAVAPEARGSGVGRWLMGELHAELLARGAALALLYPFREGFYAKLGYATTAPVLSLVVHARAVSQAFPAPLHDAVFDVVPIEGPWLWRARELYVEVARQGSGRMVRSEARWLHMFATETRQAIGVVARQSGALEGYVVFTHDCPTLHGRETLIVQELTARTISARAALLATLGRQRDQVEDIEIDVPWGDPLVFAFQDASGHRRGDAAVPHPLGRLGAGPMVRLIDARRALEQRGYAGDGELSIRLPGEPALQLAVRGGRGRVTVLHAAPTACDVEVSRPVLGSIVAAGIRPQEAAAVGVLVAAPAALRVAEELFAGPRFEVLDPF